MHPQSVLRNFYDVSDLKVNTVDRFQIFVISRSFDILVESNF